MRASSNGNERTREEAGSGKEPASYPLPVCRRSDVSGGRGGPFVSRPAARAGRVTAVAACEPPWPEEHRPRVTLAGRVLMVAGLVRALVGVVGPVLLLVLMLALGVVRLVRTRAGRAVLPVLDLGARCPVAVLLDVGAGRAVLPVLDLRARRLVGVLLGIGAGRAVLVVLDLRASGAVDVLLDAAPIESSTLVPVVQSPCSSTSVPVELSTLVPVVQSVASTSVPLVSSAAREALAVSGSNAVGALYVSALAPKAAPTTRNSATPATAKPRTRRAVRFSMLALQVPYRSSGNTFECETLRGIPTRLEVARSAEVSRS